MDHQIMRTGGQIQQIAVGNNFCIWPETAPKIGKTGDDGWIFKGLVNLIKSLLALVGDQFM